MLSFFSGRILFLLGWLRKKSADANDRKDFMDMFRNALSDMKPEPEKGVCSMQTYWGSSGTNPKDLTG